ncbi:hypothetical protein K493DRAFT_392993 [Basidiobolus meristosporus CBS 931.73]|uniref:Arrestin C-terminal-like domain-containing protein n=1 Tax=Basidiobolus meristosporus CBS 931.73 TaxID=1314790 RepID=A0A1Y1YPV7_9FUNG|nr:hypothetical protein K493DRAFT_392993 [Basidiobolus meristosporus CBS 931.73]|eukprot:ORX99863.1 hypothetical protein K493DRAFT_392993 [Basidiobolus meristosporus CBS 931.73]
MWFGNNLHIHLYNEAVVLRGDRDTASGHILRGYVTLSLRNTSKFSSLEISFQGVASIPGESSETFLHQQTQVLNETETKKAFSSGTYIYQFEFSLMGDQPETIHSRNGSIKYMLKAVATKEGFPFQTDLKAEREIQVQRIQSLDANEMDSQELLKLGEIQGELGFTIYSSSNSYQPGQEVPLKIGTKLLNTKSRIESIQACIVEVSKYHTKHGTIKSSKRPLVDTIRYEDLRRRNPNRHQNTLKIPVDSGIQPDSKSDYLSVSHSIEVQICMLSSSGVKKYILIRNQIHLTHKDSDVLPPYISLPADCPPIYS